jgi:hypothetical protein
MSVGAKVNPSPSAAYVIYLFNRDRKENLLVEDPKWPPAADPNKAIEIYRAVLENITKYDKTMEDCVRRTLAKNGGLHESLAVLELFEQDLRSSNRVPGTAVEAEMERSLLRNKNASTPSTGSSVPPLTRGSSTPGDIATTNFMGMPNPTSPRITNFSSNDQLDAAASAAMARNLDPPKATKADSFTSLYNSRM